MFYNKLIHEVKFCIQGKFSLFFILVHCQPLQWWLLHHQDVSLKMLGLYLYTLTISYKSSNMLRILNKLTLYKELQTFETNNVFLDKKVKTQQQQNNKSNIKTLAGVGDWTRDLWHPKRMRYHCTTESTESIDCSQAI